MQNVYLSNMQLQDALSLYKRRLGTLAVPDEELNTWEACGRVTAEAVYSRISSPHYNSSAVDGIATLSSKTIGAAERSHIELEEGTDYVTVDTGDPVPREMDCVIMTEDLIRIDRKKVKIYKSAVPWQNIRPLGEDIVENQLILPSCHKIRPVDIGAFLAGGVNRVRVFKRPAAGIIPTGTELVEPGTPLKPGDIIEFNSRVFSAQIEDWGGIPRRYGIVRDDYEDIKKAVTKAAAECDMVLINAGSSAGREDYTASVISELGEVLVHGIAIKPGKPVILGIIGGKPVIGIPGYPVSAYFVMELIVKDIIKAYRNNSFDNCCKAGENKKVKAILSRRVMSSLKYQEFIRVKLGYVGEKLIATPLARGAGATMSLVRADGILEVPQNLEGLEQGSEVELELIRAEEDIRNTLVSIGSHDPIIDILSDMLHSRMKDCFLSSAHTGSMGGILALRSSEAHMAPIHLLDMETGEYNLSYIKKYLPGRNILLVKCVKRIQGIMVKKGNPFGILTLEDMARSGLKFVNRQRGSGTRLLLDYNLRRLGIDSKNISGYEKEEFTHLSVAAAVASDDADCGLGIYSAARMLDLDFIPVCFEEYDFAIPEEFMELKGIRMLLDILMSREFKEVLDRLGGYDCGEAGRIIRIGDSRPAYTGDSRLPA